MHEQCGLGSDAATEFTATSRPENLGLGNRGNILPQHHFAVFSRDVFGLKAPAAVAQYTGRSDRTCRSWCADVEAPSSAAFAVIRGKEGYRFLCRVMRDDPPAWWSDFHMVVREMTASLGRLSSEGVGNVSKD